MLRQQIDFCFLYVISVQTDVTHIYALSDNPVREFDLRALFA